MYTLSGIRDLIRQRSDNENSGFISDTELNSYINTGYFELYDLVVSKNADHYISEVAFTINDSSGIYPLPSDFYKLIGVDKVYSGLRKLTLSKFNFGERNARRSHRNNSVEYRLLGNNLHILPKDNANGNYSLWYVPQAQALVNDTDTLSGLGVSQWAEYIVIDATIRVLLKEDRQTYSFEQQKYAIIKRIEMMGGRDDGEPERVRDVYSNYEEDDPEWEW